MAHERRIRDILFDRGLAPKKRFGQNFLVHRGTAERLVELAGIAGEDTILELGVGLGALTGHIAERARRVIGLEIDAGIVRWHRDEQSLPPNVELRHEDLLVADFRAIAAEIGGPLKIVANLPYSVSSPLLFKLLEERGVMAWAVLMLQKEVAQRLVAGRGSKDYGILSVLLGLCATVETLMKLGPAQFHPRPKVDSIVVRIDFRQPPATARELRSLDWELLRALVRAAFQKRRKTLRNALSSAAGLGLARPLVERALRAVGIDPDKRAEQLSGEEFMAMARAFATIAREAHEE